MFDFVMNNDATGKSSPTAETIFSAALELDGEERAAYLDRVCGDNVALRERLDALLRAHDAAPSFLPDSPAASAFDAHLPNRIVGDYELLEEIARGGMGVIYRARQRKLNRVVAVKMILAGQFASPEQAQRFRAEAEAVARLQHPNIVRIHDTGEYEGRPYFSMDYVDGPNLGALAHGKPLASRRAAAYVQRIAEAIHYAHEQGVLHRDLKPSNILIDAADQPRVTDFGLSTRLGNRGGLKTEVASRPQGGADNPSPYPLAPKLTLPGQIIGSPNYMAPEQASAQRGDVGPASDVYSLGAILFHLLTGRPPFQAEAIEEILLQLLNEEPPPPRLLNASVPRDLETICLKCLTKRADRRYPGAKALADDLQRFLNGEPIQARRAGPVARVLKWSVRHPARTVALLALAAVAVASGWTAVHIQRMNRELGLNLYVQDMNVALRSWQEGNSAQAFELLKQHIPGNGKPDLRAFEWRYLWKLCRGDYSQWLPKHRQVVGTMDFSPDGRLLATFAWDGTLRIWQRDLRRNLVTTTGVSNLGGFTADGRSLLIGRVDHSLQILDAQTGLTNRVLPNAGELVAFSPGAQLAATLTSEDGLRVFHLSEPSPRLSVPDVVPHKFDFGWDYPVSMSPDGRWLAMIQPSARNVRASSRIRVWHLESGREHSALPENRQLRCMRFSPDGAVLAVGDGSGAVRLWKLATHQFTEFSAHAGPVLSLAFSPNGELLATGSNDKQKVRLWKVHGGEPMPRNFTGQVGDVWSLAFSPQGTQLASGSRDNPIRLWNLEENAVGEKVPDRLHADDYGNFCFSQDGQWMAGGCADNTVKVWEVATLRIQGVLPKTSYVVAFSPQSDELLTATREGNPQWWNFQTKSVRSIPGYSGVLGQVISVDLSPNRRTAALGLSDGGIRILDIASGQPIGQPFRAHQGNVLSLAFSPRGDKLASGGSDKTVMVWDVPSQKGLGVCPEHKGAVFGVAISPNGETLASGCGSATIKLWNLADVSSGSTFSISLHSSVIRTLAFSVDDKTLASGSEDDSVKLWNLATRRETASFKYEAHVRLVAFSPDGNELAIITDNGTLRILHAASLEEADRDWRDFLR